MTCYHPKKGFVVGTNPDTGKQVIKYKSYDVEFLHSSNGIVWLNGDKNKLNKIDKSKLKKINLIYSDCQQYPTYYCFDFITLPCGQCLGCRIDKSKDWANRMMLEAKYHEHCVFITLTYDDSHLPKSAYQDAEGNEHTSYTLVKRDFQLFMKRLRKHYEKHDPVTGKVVEQSKIRFYACGEYGSKTFRPHYHAILYNVDFADMKLLKISPDGYRYYTSETLAKLWPNGFHLITQVTWETCAYTARYVTKKLNGEKSSSYRDLGLQPEFSLMSRRPGIGRWYYDDKAKEVYLDKSYIITLSESNGSVRRFRPPKYFDSLFDSEDHDTLEEIKENQRKVAQNAVNMKLKNTSLNLLELLEVEEYNFKHKVKTLDRSEV